jgi:Na+/H+-dicarboxylate symporter
VGIYCLSAFVGIILHLTVSLPSLFYFYTGENPYHWIYSCRRALLVALSTSSSVSQPCFSPSLFSAHLLKAATLPVTIECVTAGGVSPALANVVLPMGANVNMDGAAISFPCAILFLASSDSLVSTMTAFTWINIALCCSLGSVGAAPVPSAGMVTLITIWQTVFPSHDVPEAIAYVQVASFSLLLLPHSLFLLTGHRFLG